MSVASHAPSLPNVLRTVTLPSTVTRMITSKELLLQTSYFPRHHGLAKIWMYYWMHLKWMKYISQTETASADGQLMQSLYGNPDCYECIQPHGNWTWYEQTSQVIYNETWRLSMELLLFGSCQQRRSASLTCRAESIQTVFCQKTTNSSTGLQQ